MIELDFALREDSQRPDQNWRAVGEVLLRYDFFLGDITFVLDGADFSIRSGWVPVLDFAVCMRMIADEVKERGHDVFEATDSDLEIEFDLDAGGLLRVRANHAEGVGVTSYQEFHAAADHLLRRCRERLEASFPDLLLNHHYRKVLGAYW